MKSTTIAKTLIVITTLVVGIATKAQAQDKVCSNNTLNGTFGFRATGTLNPPQPQTGLIAIVGKETFDGNGALSFTQMVSFNGNIFPLNAVGAYQVNPDCTGTFSFQPFPGVTLNFFFVIDDNGKEFQVIQTDPGAVVTASARRQ